jgi:hypothetical protein
MVMPERLDWHDDSPGLRSSKRHLDRTGGTRLADKPAQSVPCEVGVVNDLQFGAI